MTHLQQTLVHHAINVFTCLPTRYYPPRQSILAFAGSIIGKHTTGEDQEEDLFTFDSLITTMRGIYAAAEEEVDGQDDGLDDDDPAWLVDKTDNAVKAVSDLVAHGVKDAVKENVLDMVGERGLKAAKKAKEKALSIVKPFIPAGDGNIFVKLVKIVLNCAESPADPKKGWKEEGCGGQAPNKDGATPPRLWKAMHVRINMNK